MGTQILAPDPILVGSRPSPQILLCVSPTPAASSDGCDSSTLRLPWRLHLFRGRPRLPGGRDSTADSIDRADASSGSFPRRGGRELRRLPTAGRTRALATTVTSLRWADASSGSDRGFPRPSTDCCTGAAPALRRTRAASVLRRMGSGRCYSQIHLLSLYRGRRGRRKRQ